MGEGPGRIYRVEPTGPFEDDPNLTDKRFPGNPARSYRTRQPLRVAGEVLDWEGHASEVLQGHAGLPCRTEAAWHRGNQRLSCLQIGLGAGSGKVNVAGAEVMLASPEQRHAALLRRHLRGGEQTCDGGLLVVIGRAHAHHLG